MWPKVTSKESSLNSKCPRNKIPAIKDSRYQRIPFDFHDPNPRQTPLILTSARAPTEGQIQVACAAIKAACLLIKKRKDNPVCCPSFLLGAGEQVRTANLNLGKVALCQLSYARIKLNYALDCAFLLRQVKLKNRLFSRIFRRRVELFILYTLGNAVVQKHLDKGLYLVDVLRLEYYVKGQGHRIIAA